MAKPVSIYLIAAARRIWRWHPSRRLVKDQAKEGKKFKCSECKELVTKVQIDHIEPVGKGPRSFEGWDAYYQKLFCDAVNLRALCVPCHKLKTKKEKKEGKYK